MLIDKVAESRCAGYSADYTRCHLPAGSAPRGSLIGVVCDELHADGITGRVPYPAELS